MGGEERGEGWSRQRRGIEIRDRERKDVVWWVDSPRKPNMMPISWPMRISDSEQAEQARLRSSELAEISEWRIELSWSWHDCDGVARTDARWGDIAAIWCCCHD